MANEQNLTGRGFDQRTAEEQRAIARQGGIASGEARRNKKDLRQALEMLLEREMTSKSGEKMSGTEAITAKLFEQALKGNVKAFETIRATVGQDPIQKIMVAEVEQSVIDEVEAMVTGRTSATPAAAIPEGKVQKINPETGEVLAAYKNASAAARDNGIDPSNLNKAIRAGKALRGFLWKKKE